MWVAAIFLLFCSIFSGIEAENYRNSSSHFVPEGKEIMVALKPGGDCSSISSINEFAEGLKVNVVIASKYYVNYGWLRLVDPVNNNSHTLLDLKSSRTLIANKSYEGTWEIELLFLKDIPAFNEDSIVEYKHSQYHQLKCRFAVEIDKNISVFLKPGADCSSLEPAYNFTDGSKVTVDIKNKFYINYGWLNLIDVVGNHNLMLDLKDPSKRTMVVNKSQEGLWELQLLFLKNVVADDPVRVVVYELNRYHQLLCRFNVTILDKLILQ